MAWYSKFQRTSKKTSFIQQKSGFFSSISPRVFKGWDSMSHSIDYYLKDDLTRLRARSRALVRKNTYGKRFVDIMKSNIVGPDGVKVNAQKVDTRGKPDKRSNAAVEKAWSDWCQNHADFFGKASFCELQNMSIACAAQDGEFLFEKVQSGKYGFQLKAIDAELLDTDKHEQTKSGEIRMGVEYSQSGQVVRYWFRERNHNGDYHSGKSYSIKAGRVIHCFVPLYPDQSRGIPWTHAALEATKHLEKYQEGAIVNARASANTFNVITSKAGEEYTGDEDGSSIAEGVTLDNIEAGTTVSLGEGQEVQNIDPNYPHQMFDAFVKSNLRSIASGLGISYHSLSNDLEGVNYSSIRAGVLEDRELFKSYQNWLIRCFIRPVFEEWVDMAHMSGQILLSGGNTVSDSPSKYKAASYQPRRWAWVDPQKDMDSNEKAVQMGLKSRSQIMREQGDDPETVWPEIARENERLKSLGIPVGEDSSSAEGSIDILQKEMLAYGTGVRAGALTPQLDDEANAREKMGLPAMSPDAIDLWVAQGRVRQPITLQSGEEAEDAAEDAGKKETDSTEV